MCSYLTRCVLGICEQLIYEVLVQNIAETDPLHVYMAKQDPDHEQLTSIVPTIIPGFNQINMLH